MGRYKLNYCDLYTQTYYFSMLIILLCITSVLILVIITRVSYYHDDMRSYTVLIGQQQSRQENECWPNEKIRRHLSPLCISVWAHENPDECSYTHMHIRVITCLCTHLFRVDVKLKCRHRADPTSATCFTIAVDIHLDKTQDIKQNET